MKVEVLKLFAKSISNYDKVTNISKIDKQSIYIEFDLTSKYIIDLKNNKGMIYKISYLDSISKIKEVGFYKLFNTQIKSSITYPNNRIWEMILENKNKYKKETYKFIVEFFNKQANIYIIDAMERIVLSYISNTKSFLIGEKYRIPESIQINEEKIEIKDINQYLENKFKSLYKYKLENKRENLCNKFNKKIRKLEKLLKELDSKEELEQKSKQYYEEGNLLISNINYIKYYKGMDTLQVDKRVIIINKNSKNIQNAIDYKFSKAKKMKKKSLSVFKQLENINYNIQFLKNILVNLNSITLKNLDIISNSTIFKKKKNNKSKFEIFYMDNIKISIGKNQNDNMELLKEARANDIWMHIKDIPSAHAILQYDKNKDIGIKTLNNVAKLLLEISKVTDDKYEVDYTKRKNVKIMKNKKASYVDYKTIVVRKEV